MPRERAQMPPSAFLCKIFVVIAAVLLLYFQAISRIVTGWFSFEGSHGALILGVSVYLVWNARNRLRNLSPSPNLVVGTLILAAGCLMYLSSQWSATLLLEEVSLIVVLLGITGLLLGSSWLKVLFLPIFYLLFMFTAFQEILSPLSGTMQQATAWIASSFLRLAGMPVLLSTNYLVLPHITLVVARECNGSHHIVALVALAVPLAYFTQETWLRRTLVILSALFIGMFANGLRVMMIGIWSAHHRDAPLHGPFNIFYASFIFFLGMVLLVGGSILTAKKARKTNLLRSLSPATSEQSFGQTTRPESFGSSLPRGSLPTLLALLLVLGTLGLSIACKPKPVPLAYPLANLPLRLGDWNGQSLDNLEAPYKTKSADALERLYRNSSGQGILTYLAYFPVQLQDREMISEVMSWQVESGQEITIPLETETVTLRQVLLSGSQKGETFYYCYDVNGRILTNRYLVKLAHIVDAFTRGRTNAALVVVQPKNDNDSSPLLQDELIEFLKLFIPLVQACLSS